MQPSEKAFDRVKSLLGKLDRSIDDARRRRLTEGEEDPEPAPGPNGSDSRTNLDSTIGAGSAHQADEAAKPPVRSDSKYGRARPLRDLSGPGQPSWQRA